MRPQKTMAQPGRTSLWLGNGITSGAAMVAYIMSGFEKDFGFAIDRAAGPEMSPLTEWLKKAEPRRVEELLRRFTRAKQWLPVAVELARRVGWREARAAVVFDSFEYDLAMIHNRSAPLTFIGSVATRGRG